MSKKKNRHKNLDINTTTSANNISYPKTSLKYNIGVFLLFCLLVSLVYGNSLNSPFIWDDQYLITDNHFITSFKYLPDIFQNQLYYSTAGMSNFYRPLQTLFLMVDYSIWRNNQVGYHLTSVILHLLCGFFIYLLTNLLFRKRGISILVGLLFLIHPINSTVVDYISSRADSQVTLFAIVSVYLFFKSILESKAENTKVYYFGSVVSFILALLSKELAIIIPFLILVSFVIIRKDKTISYKKLIPFFVILGVYILLRLTILNFSSLSTGEPAALHTRLLTTAESFVKLIGLLFIPVKIHIEKNIPSSQGIFQPSTLVSTIILIVIAIFMHKTKRHSKMVFFGLSWFFVTLIPMANILPINATIADHWLYLPCLGFFLAIVGGLSDWIERSPFNRLLAKKIAMSIFIVIGITFSILTVKQNTIWKDPLKFYRLALKYSPNSFRAHNEIGVIYLEQDEYNLAIPEFKKAIETNPKFDQAYDNLGVAYDKNGNLEEAIIQHNKALELSPYNAKIYNNLGNAYIKLSQFDKAVDAYNKALELNPDYKAVYNNIGVIYFKKGNYAEAQKYWERALKIDPNFKLVLDNLKILKQVQR